LLGRYHDAMAEPLCPGCRDRDAVIATLLQRVGQLETKVQDLEARLDQNSSNSCLPPSQNPLSAPRPAPKKPSGRKPGGRPGHEGHRKTRLPAERVRHTIALVPSRCENCSAPLPARPQANDPLPTWHQVAELPAFSAVVTEFQGHARTCPFCRHVTREAIPAEITADASGPRLQAALSYLAGCQHVSKRGLEDLAEGLFGVPVSLGTIANLERKTSAAAGRRDGGRRWRRSATAGVEDRGRSGAS
jgi:transposase